MNNNRYKILLVEDEVNIRRFLTALLETGSYQVVTAGTCAEALQLYGSHNPDLVILDLGLPDEDGMAFLSRVRCRDCTPIMVLSARSDEQDKVKAMPSSSGRPRSRITRSGLWLLCSCRASRQVPAQIT